MPEAEAVTGFGAILDVNTLTEYIGVQKAIVAESRWHLSPSAVSVAAVDAAKACMVRATLHAEACEHFEAGDGLLGINLNRLEDYATASKRGDVVNVSLDPETRKLHIERGRADFDMALIDPETIRKEPDIPELDLPIDVTVTGEDLSEAVGSTELVSDHLALSTEDGTLTATAAGDTDSVDVVISDGVGSDGLVRRLYSIAYLEEISGPMPDDADVRIRYGTDVPLMLSYETADGGIEVENMLAPILDN